MYWTEERHEYLKAMPPDAARDLLGSLSDDDVASSVNHRTYQEAYISDFMEFLWETNPPAFWRHVQSALLHPDGMVIGDTDGPLGIMATESLPLAVFTTLLAGFEVAKDPYLREQYAGIIAAQLRRADASAEALRAYRDWIRGLRGDSARNCAADLAGVASHDELAHWMQ